MAGPSLLLTLRSNSERDAIDNLLTRVDPSRFESLFGVSIDQADSLIDAKVGAATPAVLAQRGKLLPLLPPNNSRRSLLVDPFPFFLGSSFFLPFLVLVQTLTISKLMAIVPEGTVDPTPFIYNSTMYAMAGIMAVGAVAHMAVRPVAAKYFEKTTGD